MNMKACIKSSYSLSQQLKSKILLFSVSPLPSITHLPSSKETRNCKLRSCNVFLPAVPWLSKPKAKCFLAHKGAADAAACCSITWQLHKKIWCHLDRDVLAEQCRCCIGHKVRGVFQLCVVGDSVDSAKSKRCSWDAIVIFGLFFH